MNVSLLAFSILLVYYKPNILSVTLAFGICLLCLQIQKKRTIYDFLINRFGNLIKLMPFKMAIFDSSMRYLAFTDQWRKSLNLPENILQKSHYDLLENVSSECKTIHKLALEGKTIIAEDHVSNVNGKEIVVDFCATPIDLGFEKFLAISFLDKTNERDILSKLNKLEQEKIHLVQRLNAYEANSKVLEILNSISKLAFTELSLQEKFNRIIDLVLQTPCAQLRPQAAIFLNKGNHIELACERNLAKPLLTLGAKKQYGECLCGTVALTKKLLFTDCIDDRHTTTFEGIKPHGHFVIPLMSGENLEGVLTLYVPEHYQKSDFEEKLFENIGLVIGNVISNHKLIESLKESNTLINRLLKKQKILFGSISHDIRGYLQNLLGLIELAIEDQNPCDRQTLVMLNDIASDLKSLVEDLLDIIKLDESDFSLVNEIFDLREMLENTRRQFVPRLTNGVEFEILIEENVNNYYFGPKQRLKQLLVNLISNAVKFTHHGRITVSIKCLSKFEDSESIEITVADTGIGMPKEKLKTIFEPFSQITETSDSSKKGFGLGLMICKKIVEKMGGTIEVDSELGVGTEFKIKLILKFAEQWTQKEESETSNNLISGLKILVVDDDFTSREVLKRILVNAGHDVTTSENGLTAIKDVSEKPDLDLVIMDGEMPVLDGIKAARKIKEMRVIPIIALTGKVDLEKNSDAFDLVLSKPVNKKELLNSIHSMKLKTHQ